MSSHQERVTTAQRTIHRVEGARPTRDPHWLRDLPNHLVTVTELQRSSR